MNVEEPFKTESWESKFESYLLLNTIFSSVPVTKISIKHQRLLYHLAKMMKRPLALEARKDFINVTEPIIFKAKWGKFES
jgi:hypothetical protein